MTIQHFGSPTAQHSPCIQPLLREGLRSVLPEAFVDRTSVPARTLPLRELRDIRVTTHHTRASRHTMLVLAFDHGVETLRVPAGADCEALVASVIRGASA